MLARIISQSEGIVNYWHGSDDELDAALILSGYEDPPSSGRYCFQTTYVDECYTEYYEHKGEYKIIWVIRNPHSVVYSLLYNWRPAALDGTFSKFTTHTRTGFNTRLFQLFGQKFINRTRKACELYNLKTHQLFQLYSVFGPNKILIVDYDELVLQKEV
ncbi:sulfotransferase domain-containing protein, partial [Chloroflexota bacterium]